MLFTFLPPPFLVQIIFLCDMKKGKLQDLAPNNVLSHQQLTEATLPFQIYLLVLFGSKLATWQNHRKEQMRSKGSDIQQHHIKSTGNKQNLEEMAVLSAAWILNLLKCPHKTNIATVDLNPKSTDNIYNTTR